MLEGLYTDVIVTLSTGALIVLFNSTRKKIKHVESKVDGLKLQLEEHTIVVKDIALCNNVMRKIDSKIRQCYEYIDENDPVAQTFLYLQGEIAKSCIEWAIRTNLEVTKEEIFAKFESASLEAQEHLLKIESDFNYIISPKLSCLYKTHLKKVLKIALDPLINSKVDRFFTLTEQNINDILTTFIKERIMFKSKSKKK